MSSTVVMALVRQRDVYIAHAGDSRAYLFRKGKLEKLTRDHSIVAAMVELGQISPEQAKVHPERNRITRCIGMKGCLSADVRHISVGPGSRLLLCTDGLTGMLTDEAIARILRREKDAKSACRRLIAEANRAGGHDNITALIVDFGQS
jgi:protein phosphatase